MVHSCQGLLCLTMASPWQTWIFFGKHPSPKERFASVAMISANSSGHALITDVGTKSTGEDLKGIEVSNFQTSSIVTSVKEDSHWQNGGDHSWRGLRHVQTVWWWWRHLSSAASVGRRQIEVSRHLVFFSCPRIVFSRDVKQSLTDAHRFRDHSRSLQYD